MLSRATSGMAGISNETVGLNWNDENLPKVFLSIGGIIFRSIDQSFSLIDPDRLAKSSLSEELKNFCPDFIFGDELTVFLQFTLVCP